MTYAANHTGPGIRGIEIPVAADIKKGAVYRYEAEPIGTVPVPAGQIVPPEKIVIRAQRLHPSTTNPGTVISPYTVDNKK
jgi:hypothetical protein